MFRLPKIFFDTPGDAGTGGGIPPVSDGLPGQDKDDIIDFLGGEDDEEEDDEEEVEEEETPEEEEVEEEEDKDKGKDKKKKKDDEEEDDELDDILEELEEPDDDKLELVTPVKRKEILAKYPQLFKDFPYLEKAYYREQQYTEMFPTIDEAKEAQGKAQALDKFEDDLFRGNVATVLQAVKEQDQESFHRIVDNYMNALGAVDKSAHMHVIGNITKHTVIAMLEEAKRATDEHVRNGLQLTASELYKFVFGNTKFSEPTNLAKPLEKSDGREDAIREREQQFAERQFNSVRDDLNTRVNNTLSSTLEQNIDPKGSMTEYVKKNAIREASETLAAAMKQDKRFGEILNRLWKHAASQDFSADSVDRIRKAYLSRAKTLLPAVIKRARRNALMGMGKRVKSNKREKEDKDTPRSHNRGNKEEKVPAGMSTLDFLNQD